MWFSAMVRLLLSIEDEGPVDYWRSVFVFQAPDWEPARLRAIELGRAREESYLNVDGKEVELSLVEVETLDCLGDEPVDSREVYFESVPTGETKIEGVFHPEDSKPGSTGV
jgi:hypothetical protein